MPTTQPACKFAMLATVIAYKNDQVSCLSGSLLEASSASSVIHSLESLFTTHSQSFITCHLGYHIHFTPTITTLVHLDNSRIITANRQDALLQRYQHCQVPVLHFDCIDPRPDSSHQDYPVACDPNPLHDRLRDSHAGSLRDRPVDGYLHRH